MANRHSGCWVFQILIYGGAPVGATDFGEAECLHTVREVMELLYLCGKFTRAKAFEKLRRQGYNPRHGSRLDRYAHLRTYFFVQKCFCHDDHQRAHLNGKEKDQNSPKQTHTATWDDVIIDRVGDLGSKHIIA